MAQLTSLDLFSLPLREFVDSDHRLKKSVL